MGMTLYRTIWGNEINRTTTLSTLFAFFALFTEIYLIFWEKRLWEPLEFLLDNVPLIGWKLLDIAHVLLWLLVMFFGIIAYATVKEVFETPAGWIDLTAGIVVIGFLLGLIFDEWIMLLFVSLGLLETLYFYASIGKS